VGAQLHAGRFGMARETADAFAVAARAGAEMELGLGAALGQHMEISAARSGDSSFDSGAAPGRHSLHDSHRTWHRIGSNARTFFWGSAGRASLTDSASSVAWSPRSKTACG